jgi:hypothetical protein
MEPSRGRPQPSSREAPWRSPGGRRILAALGATIPVAAWLVGGSIVPACGGSSGSSPPTPATVGPPPDLGGAPPDCTQTDPFEFKTIEDFEGFSATARYYGAATGWFTNNEVCYPWTQAATECADAGMVCYPGSQASPECLRDGAPTPIWSSCFGTGAVDCSNADAALATCQQQCYGIQQSPPFKADPLPAEAIPTGSRCGSYYAMHIKGGPFSNWGGNIGTRFALGDGGGMAGGLDVSQYEGVSLWMRTAPGYATAAKIALADPHTDSQYNMYPPDGGTPFCDPNPNCSAQSAQGNMNCFNVGCDKFGQFTPLTEDWRLYLIPFTEMRQGGWGKPWPELDLTQIVSFEVDYTQGTWDFWVDDISFYRRKSQ